MPGPASTKTTGPFPKWFQRIRLRGAAGTEMHMTLTRISQRRRLCFFNSNPSKVRRGSTPNGFVTCFQNHRFSHCQRFHSPSKFDIKRIEIIGSRFQSWFLATDFATPHFFCSALTRVRHSVALVTWPTLAKRRAMLNPLELFHTERNSKKVFPASAALTFSNSQRLAENS